MAIDVNKPTMRREVQVAGQANVEDRSHRFGVVREIKKRIIVVASALQKHGKDHWGFTAPGPIAVHAFDEGYDEPANKFIKGFEGYPKKVIKICEYEVPEGGKKFDAALQSQAESIWEDFVANYRWSLRNFRSVVVDTATEMWELLRLARFGALSTGQTTSYGPVNAEMRKLIREGYEHDANIIFLQKLKKKYIGRDWSGEYEPAGWGDMSYESQVVIRLWREDPAVFHTTIEDCRQEPRLNGVDMTEVSVDGVGILEFNDFPAVAARIFNEDRE